MNKLLALLSIVLFLTTCNKDDNPYSGTATAIKNGEKWEAGAFASTSNAYKIEDGFIGVQAKISNSNGFQEDLAFGKVPIQEGTYDLGLLVHPYTFSYVGSAFYNSIEDGHVLTNIYIIDTTATDNYFEVVRFSDNDKEIEVKFTVSFILDQDGVDTPNTPKEVKFTDGYIKSKIKY